jgi:serine/threonine protein kinase
LVRAAGGGSRVIGFLMPRLRDAFPIHILYDVKERHARCPEFSYDSLCRAARNLASAAWAIHEAGYVIGDVNESNILVTRSALITLVDTDSFQVVERAVGRVYRCPVGTDMFTPPELQGVNFAEVDRSPEHDLFGLAVLFFRLLMEGSHPFACVFRGGGEPPEYGECLVKGYFPYGGRASISPPPLAPPFEMLHPQLRELFRQSFVEGHAAPRRRPDAQTWYQALTQSESALVTCARNEQHLFFSHCRECPWCERARRLGIPGWDPFPSPNRARGFAGFSYSSARTTGRPAFSATTSAAPPTQSTPPYSFSASTASVNIGQSVTLRWSVPNAQTVRITDQSGRTVFAGTTPSGLVTVYPTKTVTYSLIASGVGVGLPRPVTVAVAETPLPEGLRPDHLELNQPYSLKAARVGLRETLVLKDGAVRLSPLMRLKSYTLLAMYGKLKRVSGRFMDYDFVP